MEKRLIELAANVARRIASRRTVTGYSVEDVVQDVVLQVWRDGRKMAWDTDARFAAWVRTVAVHDISQRIAARKAQKRGYGWKRKNLDTAIPGVDGGQSDQAIADETLEFLRTNLGHQRYVDLLDVLIATDGAYRSSVAKDDLNKVDGAIKRMRRRVRELLDGREN